MRGSAIRSCIERLIRHWQPVLGLDRWRLELRFDEHKHQGTCLALPQYQEATIRFNLPLLSREIRTPAELEDLVVHELCHCLTCQSWGAGQKAPQEFVTTQVARAVLRAAGRHG